MDDNDELTAERILEQRFNEDNQLQYLIKWAGEDEEYATWESYDEVTQSWPHLLHQFNKHKRKKDVIVIDQEDEYPPPSYYHHHPQQLNEYDVPSHSSTSTAATLSPTMRYNSRSSSSTCHTYNAQPPPPTANNLSPHPPPVMKPKLKPKPMTQPAIPHRIPATSSSMVHVKTEPTNEEYSVKRAVITPRRDVPHATNQATEATLRMKQERETMHTTHATHAPPPPPPDNHNKSTSNSMDTIATHDESANPDTPRDVPTTIPAVDPQITVHHSTNLERMSEAHTSENTEAVYKPTLQLDFDVHHNEIAVMKEDGDEGTMHTVQQDTVEDTVHKPPPEEQEVHSQERELPQSGDVSMEDQTDDEDIKMEDATCDDTKMEDTTTLEMECNHTMEIHTTIAVPDTVEASTVSNDNRNTNGEDESDTNHEDSSLKLQKADDTQLQKQMAEDHVMDTNHALSVAIESTQEDAEKEDDEENEAQPPTSHPSTPNPEPSKEAEPTHESQEVVEPPPSEPDITDDTSFAMQEEAPLQHSNDHPLMMNDDDDNTTAVAEGTDETKVTDAEPSKTDATTETTNPHDSESEDTDSDDSDHDSEQVQAPSITQLHVADTHTHLPPTKANNTSHSMVDDNSSTASPTSTAVSPPTNRQFQDHLPSLSNNPSMADPGHHSTPNPSIVQPHYLSSQPPPPNNNAQNIRKPQPPNQQYTLLHLGQQPTYELNSFHSLYIPPSAHHHMDSTMDSNSEYNNHQSINTDSTNSSQTQTHSTIHSSVANPNHHHNTSTTNISITTNPGPSNPPTHGIFMPSINNPPTTLHRHHSAPNGMNGINGSSQPAPPPLPPIPHHQLTHFSTVPVVTRIPLPMAGSGPPPNAQHPVLLSPANAHASTVTPPNTSSSITPYSSNNNTFDGHTANDEPQNASNEFHHSSTYYNDSANQPQSSSNSINSLSQQCGTYNNGDNFQNVNFQEIKANGAPYHCPFCETLSFQQWADWKQHWYELHNSKYFDDAQKLKTQSIKPNNHKITTDSLQTTTFQSNLMSSMHSMCKSFPPQPTNMVFQSNESIQFQLQSVNKSHNNSSSNHNHNHSKKRTHESMTNAQDDEYAPRAKRQKISHSAYNNVSSDESHKKSKKQQQEDDDYVVSHDEEDDDEEDDDEEEEKESEEEEASSTDSEMHRHKKRKHRSHRSVKKKTKAKKTKKKTILLQVKKKRGRGRPRKNENIRKDSADKATKPKRKRGRPRKYESEYGESQYSSRSTRSKRQKLSSEERSGHKQPKAAVCCKICNVNCTNNAGLSNHIRARHGMHKLRDYFAMNDRAIKDKQNEMHYNDTNRLIGISPTHKSKNIKFKYKCTVCDPATPKFCAGHVGLNSHLRAHVKNGDVSESDQKKLYKQIMKHPIPIYARIPAPNTTIEPPPKKKDPKEDTSEHKSSADKPTSFKNEVIGDEESSADNVSTNDREKDDEDDDDEDDEPRRKLRGKSKPKATEFKMPSITLPPYRDSENTPPFPADATDATTQLSKQPSSTVDRKKSKRKKDDLISNIGRIPKKTPEQQKQQQMLEQQSSILYPQRQKREFSPPDSPSPNVTASPSTTTTTTTTTTTSTYSKSNKYRTSSSHYSSHDRQPSHSRSSSSSHSSHSRSYRDGKYRNNHSRNNKNRRSSKYNSSNRSNHYYRSKNNASSTSSSSNGNSNGNNMSSNPLYPDNYSPYRTHKMSNKMSNDDHHNVPALQPLHSPKHVSSSNSHSMRKSSSQRHYYDNSKTMAHYNKYIKNDGSMNGENRICTYDDHEVKTPSSANSGTTTDDIA